LGWSTEFYSVSETVASVSAYINETPGQGKQHNKHAAPASPAPRPSRPPSPDRHRRAAARRRLSPSPSRVGAWCARCPVIILSSSGITSRSSDLAGDRQNLAGTLIPANFEGPSGRSPAGIAPRSSSHRRDVEVISPPRRVSAGTEKRRRRQAVRKAGRSGRAFRLGPVQARLALSWARPAIQIHRVEPILLDRGELAARQARLGPACWLTKKNLEEKKVAIWADFWPVRISIEALGHAVRTVVTGSSHPYRFSPKLSYSTRRRRLAEFATAIRPHASGRLPTGTSPIPSTTQICCPSHRRWP
jgi:hypothetical protein